LLKTLVLEHYGTDAASAESARLLHEHVVVIRNDQYTWATVRDSILPHVDNVVISPGPGTPHRAADFGVCADIIAHTRESGRAVLGVCLGHQGIAHAFGARVEQCAVPVHGQTSQIEIVEAGGLFCGIPSGFRAVRYHSLVVADDVGSELQVLARAQGSVEFGGRSVPSTHVMAVRHRSLPLWGVQFHPESVCTEHGKQMFSNFARLTQQCVYKHVSTGIPPIVQAMSVEAQDQRVWKRSPAQPRFELVAERVDLDHAHADLGARLFERLHADDRAPVWLDASDGSGMSVLASAAHAATVRYTVATRSVRAVRMAVSEDREEELLHTETLGELFWTWMQRITDNTRCVGESEEGMPPFRCGWIGYFGYEMKDDGTLINMGADQPDASPDTQLTFVDRCVVVVDSKTVWVLALARRSASAEFAWLDRASGFASAANARTWVDAQVSRVREAAMTEVTPNYADPTHSGSPGTLRPVMGRTEYLDAIAHAQQLIAQGESYEICLTNEFRAHAPCDLATARRMYMQMRRSNPAPFGAFLWDAPRRAGVLSCSPERFQRTHRPPNTDNDDEVEIEMKPIKGTSRREPQPRCGSELDAWRVEDGRRARELRESVKERAENLMIVDLIRHDLNAVAHDVRVTRLMHIESFARVHQMVTTVRARARVSAVAALAHCFPPGSMTGAPKARTLQIISALERRRRGVYSGVLGYVSAHGGCSDWAVVIRTAVVSGGCVSVGAGGALTILSEPKAEWAEVETKLHATFSSIIC
ncbi:para-aminobenzoate synthase, (PABA), partial [Coemansia sp. RSA 2618]